MTEILDFARRRPVLSIAIVFAAIALAVVAVILGAKLWQALAGLLGIGVGAAQPLRKYAQADNDRIKQQTEVDQWKAKRLAEAEANHQQAERDHQQALKQKFNDIDKGVEQDTPDTARKRVLDAIKGPLQCVLWLALWIGLTGCASVNGTPGGVQVRDVCFSRQETADILKRIAALQSAVKQCQAGAAHSKQVTDIECQAAVAKWQVEARACSEKLLACSARTCPTCWLPWIITGVALTVTVTVGVYAGVQMSRGVP